MQIMHWQKFAKNMQKTSWQIIISVGSTTE